MTKGFIAFPLTFFSLVGNCRWLVMFRSNWKKRLLGVIPQSGFGQPSVSHALIVTFVHYFSWGLLTVPSMVKLSETFAERAFLMDGLIYGIRGTLAFIVAPLMGAVSDIWGRKPLMLMAVVATYSPIPMLIIKDWWFFITITISGVCGTVYSTVLAYVADVTAQEERSKAFGLVSATCAAAMVLSPALGSLLMDKYGLPVVVFLAAAIGLINILFIWAAVPESLELDHATDTACAGAHPFVVLRELRKDKTLLLICLIVLLSTWPEAGEESSVPLYLTLNMGFGNVEVSVLVGLVAVLGITANVTLGLVMNVLGARGAIITGLVLEICQLLLYGFGRHKWMMWMAGLMAATGTITESACCVFSSMRTHPQNQGAVQGLISGMMDLSEGLGPAIFGILFYVCNQDTNGPHKSQIGLPFVVGAISVLLALVLAKLIVENVDKQEVYKSNGIADEMKPLTGGNSTIC
ncbi:hippocampus abundant transcript-like protein 1 [Drosophila subobscura]|uniref:hippocampus abundant transcript-like protein 1 n=1 Tax=Drosophila subobscura TaxID=7241 RepID=UPI00155A885E|nr:hippocampus abundant transcript-like protein 1 [Drosophila subobscura]